MIPNYRPPRHEIEQDFADQAPAPTDRNNLIVIGPAYIHADPEAGNLVQEDYAGSAELDYRLLDAEGAAQDMPANHEVDTDNVNLVASGLWLQLYEKGAAGGAAVDGAFSLYPQDRTGRVLFFPTAGDIGFLDTGSTTPADDFDLGRSIQAGDHLKIEGSAATVYRTVATLLGKDTEASLDANGYGFFGAADKAASGNALVTGLVHSAGTIEAADVTLALGSLTGDDLVDWARRYGAISPTSGLRVHVALTCTTGGDVESTDDPVFTATVAGRTTSVTADQDGTDSATDFTILGESVVVDGKTVWTAGETLSFYVDLPLLASNCTLNGATAVDTDVLNFTGARRKIASSIVVEVTDVSLDGATSTLRISDTQGLMTPISYSLTDPGTDTADISLTYDGVAAAVTISLDQDFFNNTHVGMRVSATVIPPSRSSTVFDKVQLDAPLGAISNGATNNDRVKVTAFVKYTGDIPATDPVSGDLNFTAGADSVVLEAAVHASVAGYTLASNGVKPALSGKGKIAVEWRALVPASSAEVPFLVDGTTSILTQVGSTAMASELGFGLYMGVRAAGKAVYGLRVGGTALADWAAAIDTLKTLKNIYTIAPLTDDEEVLKLFSAHAAEMNRPEIKKFRRVYAGVDSPGEYTKLATFEDAQVTATITEGDASAYTLVTFANAGLDLNTIDIYKGDKLRVVATGQEYLIDYRGGEDTLVLQAGPGAPIAAATAVEIIAADTPQNIADYVGSYAERLGSTLEEDRRINCVWSDDGVYDTLDGSPVVIPNRFLAAEAAGYRVSLLPQQSLTRQQAAGITDAPSMYASFTPDQLDAIAARGVWIVTQDGPDEQPYYRHQLTTAADGGSLRYEDSAGVIYDFVCFYLDDLIDPLIGKRNVTRRTLAEIKNLVVGRLITATTAPAGQETIGPMLSAFYDRDGNTDTINVDFDPDFKDSVLIYVEIEIPLPLNYVRTRILARTVTTATGPTSEILVQAA